MKHFGMLACMAVAFAAQAEDVRVQPIDTAGVASAQGLRATDPATGATLHVYADAVSLPLARHELPRLLHALAVDAELFGVPASTVRWSSVQFTHDDAIADALRAHELGMWRVRTDARGAATQDGPLPLGADTLRRVLPHEQAHALDVQFGRADHDVPFWWIEGIATWAGDRATDATDPDPAAKARRLEAEARELREADGRIDRRAMHRSDTPKPDAILRQLSPAQRTEFLATGKVPAISLMFTDDDMEQSPHMGAHYVAAARVFARVEREAGLDGLQRWLRAVAREPAHVLDSDRLAALCLAATGVDIRPDLDNHAAQRR